MNNWAKCIDLLFSSFTFFSLIKSFIYCFLNSKAKTGFLRKYNFHRLANFFL